MLDQQGDIHSLRHQSSSSGLHRKFKHRLQVVPSGVTGFNFEHVTILQPSRSIKDETLAGVLCWQALSVKTCNVLESGKKCVSELNF